mgnify:CR=1 FL=1
MRLPISLDRSSLAQSAAVSSVTLAALALLGLVLAYWTWAWLAPRPEPRAPALEGQALHLEPAYRLFGGAPQGASDAAPTALAIDLLGVAAASGGKPGYAVLRLDAKRIVAVREGDEIEPGVKLAEVHAERVVLERGGVRETVAFPQKGKSK